MSSDTDARQQVIDVIEKHFKNKGCEVIARYPHSVCVLSLLDGYMKLFYAATDDAIYKKSFGLREDMSAEEIRRWHLEKGYDLLDHFARATEKRIAAGE